MLRKCLSDDDWSGRLRNGRLRRNAPHRRSDRRLRQNGSPWEPSSRHRRPSQSARQSYMLSAPCRRTRWSCGRRRSGSRRIAATVPLRRRGKSHSFGRCCRGSCSQGCGTTAKGWDTPFPDGERSCPVMGSSTWSHRIAGHIGLFGWNKRAAWIHRKAAGFQIAATFQRIADHGCTPPAGAKLVAWESRRVEGIRD